MLWRVCLQYSKRFNVRKQLCTAFNFTKMPYYAVAKGRSAGIFMTWPDCEAQVKGFPGARYKKFNSVVEAQDFITSAGGNTNPKPKKPDYNSTINNSSHNLKRSFNTSSSYKHKDNEVPKKKSKSKRKSYSESDNEASDGFEDFNKTKKSKSKRKSYSESDNDASDGFEDFNKTKKSKSKRKSRNDSDGAASDGSDDLNTIICKQMDDIEKRLKGFEKGVDKIIKKSASKTGRKSILIDQKDRAVGFTEDQDGYVQVYTDGACSANGTRGAKAGLGVYWGDNHPLNRSEPVSGRATNNCGEIQAASCAIKTALENGVTKLSINTDSQFLINSVTKWIPGWKRKGWKLQSGGPVKNEIDFKELDQLQSQLDIKWNYVEAHRGVHGNQMADQLAKAGAAMYNK